MQKVLYLMSSKRGPTKHDLSPFNDKVPMQRLNSDKDQALKVATGKAQSCFKARTKGEGKKNVSFGKVYTVTDSGLCEMKELESDNARTTHLKMKDNPEQRHQKFLELWRAEKKYYNEKMVPEEDALIQRLADKKGLTALTEPRMTYLFSKLRQLLELQWRVINLKALKHFRFLLGHRRINLAMEIIKEVEVDAVCMEFVDKEDYSFSSTSAAGQEDDFLYCGISVSEQEIYVDKVARFCKNDDFVKKWAAYLQFFNSPATQWLIESRKVQQIFHSFLDDAIIYCMLNNLSNELAQVTKWKIPPKLMETGNSKLTPVARADQRFSTPKRNSCPNGCVSFIFLPIVELIY